jgi:uncharacterized protein (DUF488 family)
MLLNRQKQLLALLAAHAGQLGNLDFQKLLFLYCLEVEKRPSYDFVPYRFGGFSFTSYADKRRLMEEGLLADQERMWKLAADGEKVASARISSATKAEMKLFATRYTALRGDALVAHVYRKYPYYAIRSEMASRVLKNDKAALQAIKGAMPVRRPASLCTIGYEGLSLEAYLNKLLVAGVTLLCDVRRNPLSRKYGFSRSALARSCEGVGLRYEHLPELGIDGERRRHLVTQEDYDTLFSAYREDTIAQQGHALGKLGTWIAGGHRVALSCYEHAPHQCHRHCVAEHLEKRLGCLDIVDHL